MVLSKAKIKSIVENFIENADEKDLKNLSELIDKKKSDNFWKEFDKHWTFPFSLKSENEPASIPGE